jgi:hypothetical protein
MSLFTKKGDAIQLARRVACIVAMACVWHLNGWQVIGLVKRIKHVHVGAARSYDKKLK